MTSDQSGPAATGPLTKAEIEAFTQTWYHLLDIHPPPEDLLAMVAEEGLEMHFPEGVLRGAAEFRRWYEGVTRIFCDEVHTVTRVEVAWEGDRANVEVVVNWQTRRWYPPAAASQWLNFDAYQRWVMIRSAATGAPVILTYIVDRLEAREGSPPL